MGTTARMDPVLLVVALLMATAGGFVAALGLRRRRRLAFGGRTPERAAAEVVAVGRSWWPMLLDPLGGPVPRATVWFRTNAGEEVTTELLPGGPPVKPGDHADVLLDPAAPGDAVLAGLERQQRVAATMLVVSGAIVILVAAALVALASGS